MTGHRDDDLTAALHNLRRAVRQQVPVPDTGALRAAATRQLRVRRTAIAALAAGAVVVIAIGGAVVLQPSAAPPIPPAESPPIPPAESPTARPTDRPVPPPPDDPIVHMDWSTATIDVPPQDGCPSGSITFGPNEEAVPSPPTATGPVDSLPRITLYTDDIAYGDLTGDGRAEAAVLVACAATEAESGDGEGQALVVAREPDGSLTGLAWVGPRGAVYQDHWIAGGHLYLDAQPWHGDTFRWAPGLALRISGEGDGFSGYQQAPEYPPIVPIGAGAGPPVQLGPVARGLACPDAAVRFDGAATARVDGATYDLAQPGVPASGPHLVDLDHTGQRLLMLAIGCTQSGNTTQGLAVFAPTTEGFRGVSVLLPPESAQIVGWRMVPSSDGTSRDLALHTLSGGSDADQEQTYRWDGAQFQPVD